jgi:MinD-like ATPase involved in chromosome partitioning or flagellar assembly
MSGEHYVVLGAARPRATWFGEVGRWATSAALPIEFVKCVSTDEVRARLASGRLYSALLVDEGSNGVDRDLLDEARRAGCAPVVVTHGPSRREWSELGAAGVLSEPLDREALLSWLRDNVSPLVRTDMVAPEGDTATDATWSGRLVTVVGAGGTGTSTIATALAQSFGADAALSGRVALADASLDASLALLHDTGDVVPGLQELVELHRTRRPDGEQVRSCLWSFPERGYDLLLGVRRHRDWTSSRPRAVEATVRSLTASYAVVVADTDTDLEGQAETGSLDVEERNACARSFVAAADLVVVTAAPDVVGIHRLVRTLAALLAFGVEPARILPVVNRAPRSPRHRAELSRAVALLLGELVPGSSTVSPLMVAARRELPSVQHDGSPLPRAFCGSIGTAVSAVLGRLDERADRESEPALVEPGSLGTGPAI